MMGAFDAIRPYADAEVRPVLARLLADPAFLGTLTRFRFPRLAGPLVGCSPLIAARLRSEFASIDSVSAAGKDRALYRSHHRACQ